MHDIDCHIIIHKEPQWKIDRCLASLEGQPVNLHLVQGEDGDFPPHRGRAKGFAMGSAPYVTYVDPDDWLDGDYFANMAAHLSKADILYGRERVWRNGAQIGENFTPHHAFVVRREHGQDVAKLDRRLSKLGVREAVYNWDITGGRYGS